MCPGLKPRADNESRLKPAGAEQGRRLGRMDPAARPVPGMSGIRIPHPGPCPGLKPPGYKAKPTEGAGDAGIGGRLDRVHPRVVIGAPSVGLPNFSPAALAPGIRRGADTAPSGIVRGGTPAGFSRLFLVSPGLEPRAPATAWDPSHHPSPGTGHRAETFASPTFGPDHDA